MSCVGVTPVLFLFGFLFVFSPATSWKTALGLSYSVVSSLVFLAPKLGKRTVLILLELGFIQELSSVKYI